LFESTVNPTKISAMLRDSARQALIFAVGSEDRCFRRYIVVLCFASFEAIAKTTSSAIKAVPAVRDHILGHRANRGFCRGFGECMMASRSYATSLEHGPLPIRSKLTLILIQEFRRDLIDTRPAIADIPEGGASLRTGWNANRGFDQGEELFEQAV
jgi:hypothetical protein